MGIFQTTNYNPGKSVNFAKKFIKVQLKFLVPCKIWAFSYQSSKSVFSPKRTFESYSAIEGIFKVLQGPRINNMPDKSHVIIIIIISILDQIIQFFNI